MKKAEEIAVENHLFKSVDVIYDNFALQITRDCYVQTSRNIIRAIKQAQEDAIRETVKECANSAKTREATEFWSGQVWDDGPLPIIVDKNSILSIADKLIKEL